MFKRFIRDFIISVNHKKRVNSIVIKSNEEIVRKLDAMKDEFLKSERKGDKEAASYYGAIQQTLEWLIDESK